MIRSAAAQQPVDIYEKRVSNTRSTIVRSGEGENYMRECLPVEEQRTWDDERDERRLPPHEHERSSTSDEGGKTGRENEGQARFSV